MMAEQPRPMSGWTGPVRPCSHPGCATLVPFGRCSAHTPERQSAALSLAVRTHYSHTHKTFYNSKAWKLARADYMVKHPICETCWQAPTTEVHHKISLDEIERLSLPVEFKLDEGNFKGQCKPCHSRETVRQDGGFGRTPQAGK